MDDFETLLAKERANLRRYIVYRIGATADADDILQDVCLAAYRHFDDLKDPASFKSWLIGIARNRCTDHFRRKAARPEIPMDGLPAPAIADSRFGVSAWEAVGDTIDRLPPREREILYLTYWENLPRSETAARLHIPVGTVKSRLHTARENFRSLYPKGEITMKKLPELMPGFSIEPVDAAPFSVKWEELMGWFLVPRLGEKLTWGIYDIPSRQMTCLFDMKVTGKAKVHGIEGVELTAREAPCSDKEEAIDRTFVAQLTDTHCRYLATLRNDGDVRNFITFLDGKEFLDNWGFGEDNIGNETNLRPKGDIKRNGNTVTCADKEFLLDIVGRYHVTICGKTYDTVCVLDVNTYNSGVLSEQFLDKNGRTILWRRFNRDDWAFDRYGSKWSDLLPGNDRLIVDGTPYVNWYDCVTDYIL